MHFELFLFFNSCFYFLHTVYLAKWKRKKKNIYNITLSYEQDAEETKQKNTPTENKNNYIWIIAQNKIFYVRNYTKIVTSFRGVIGIDAGESVSYGHECSESLQKTILNFWRI